MRDQFKMAFSAARMARHIFDQFNPTVRIPSRQLRAAVEYAETGRGDILACQFPGRMLRALEYKRDRATNPWKYQSFNCRCVTMPIEVSDEC